MLKITNSSGITLLELLISLAILGIIMITLHQVMGTAISAYESRKGGQVLLAQARHAMERMAMFVSETDYILEPDTAGDEEIIRVSDRITDTYDNATLTYVLDGDGYLDADSDYDGLVNEDPAATPESLITFNLDKTNGSNWKLNVEMPDYSTADLNDSLAGTMICEHVTSFKCNLLSPNLVEIDLTLNDGKDEVNLKTRVKARLIE